MLNKILGAAAAIAMAVSPAAARVESGTSSLIKLIGDSGIAIRMNTDDCATGEYLGLYRHRGMKRAFILCPGETVDAADHMVVRHEAIHVIQHCVNSARGTSVWTAILQDEEELMEFARQYLTEQQISEIKRLYPREQWQVEFEAFAGMTAFTSNELAEMFTQACLFEDN